MSTIQSVSALGALDITAPPALAEKAMSYSDTVSIKNGTPTPTTNIEISPSSRLQSERELSIALGARTRSVDATFGQAIELIEGMKEQLTQITKQYPPFASDNNERVQYLNNFSGLRAQIEALTFKGEPRPSDKWASLKFPTEQPSWDIPSLNPTQATDQEIREAEAYLTRINVNLTEQRQSLYDSVMAALSDSASPDQVRKIAQQLSGYLAD